MSKGAFIFQCVMAAVWLCLACLHAKQVAADSTHLLGVAAGFCGAFATSGAAVAWLVDKEDLRDTDGYRNLTYLSCFFAVIHALVV